MITHDAETGIGGLDASILFELDRDENPGVAFNDTFGFLSNFYTIRSGAADLLALALVAAAATCGGPKIEFRAGRIDAAAAGPLGVPEPQQDLATHTGTFAAAGFSTTDMITMVACGHTLGGVHGVNFPNITGDPSVGQVSHFEGENGTSFSEFDNVVVTQYLDGTSQNPLVVGSNDTTNSDKRIFGADSNETMNALADPAVFNAKCADVLGRMIDTVPSTVTLSDPIEAIDIKPYISLMALNSNGTIDFQGTIRVRITDGTGRDYTDLAAHLTYADRNGVNTSTVIAAPQATYQGGLASGFYGESFMWFQFSTVLEPSASIGRFNVHLTTPSTNATVVYDNAGSGFPVPDGLLYQQLQSCLNSVNGTLDLTVVAAVRQDRAAESLRMDLVHQVVRPGIILNALEVRSVDLQPTAQALAGYTFFNIEMELDADSRHTTFDVILGEGIGAITITGQTNVLDSVACQSL
jgi:hypothetical protein